MPRTALSQIITGGQDLRGVRALLANDIGLGRAFGAIPWMVVIAAVVTARRRGRCSTSPGSAATPSAVGSNAEAARRAGINVRRHLIKVYGLQGLLAGLAGFLAPGVLQHHARSQATPRTTSPPSRLWSSVAPACSAAAAPSIGLGIGVFIPAVLGSGFVIVGVQSYWQNVALGIVLVLAVYVDQLRRRSQRTSLTYDRPVGPSDPGPTVGVCTTRTAARVSRSLQQARRKGEIAS